MSFFIKNRVGQNISLMVEQGDKGIVFIMHGLGGFKEQNHIKAFANAFSGFTRVLFDTTNSFGESEGDYENATVTNYLHDLEDVIDWASGQKWYREPFSLIGHSLGGLCVGVYAENNPERIEALALISPIISGKLNKEAQEKYRALELEEWNRTGWRIEPSISKPGVLKKLNWTQHAKDGVQYDVLAGVSRLTMPVLLITGTEDRSSPAEHLQLLFAALPGKREIHLLEGAGHNFLKPEEIEQLTGIIQRWITAHSL